VHELAINRIDKFVRQAARYPKLRRHQKEMARFPTMNTQSEGLPRSRFNAARTK
jgi:hypothetical protein